MKFLSLIVAVDEKNGIGKKGDLAWRLSADLKHFKEITTFTTNLNKKNAVIMGRKTWDSLPVKFKPLPDRRNIVLTTQKDMHFPQGVLSFQSLEEAVKSLEHSSDIENIFIIGGAQIYNQALAHPACRKIYLTQVKNDFSCDVFFPNIPTSYKAIVQLPWASEGSLQYRFCQYQKMN